MPHPEVLEATRFKIKGWQRWFLAGALRRIGSLPGLASGVELASFGTPGLVEAYLELHLTAASLGAGWSPDRIQLKDFDRDTIQIIIPPERCQARFSRNARPSSFPMKEELASEAERSFCPSGAILLMDARMEALIVG